jgi:dienelactone hydrolase
MPSTIQRAACLAAMATLLLLPGRAAEAQAQDAQRPAVPSRIEVLPIASRTLSGEEFLRGGAAGREAQLAGELRLPPGLAPGARAPAVVLIHGSGGISGSMDHWVRELNGIGLATFVLDTFAGRGIVSTVQDQNQLHSLAMMVDAYRALERLAAHPRIQADRIAVMGFSKGAVPAVYAAMERFQRLHGPDGRRFAAHVGLYTPCNVAYREDTRVGPAPIRMFHGIADDYVPIGPCRDYTARLRAAGADVTLTEYPDAQHGFDNPLSPRLVAVPGAQTTRNCRLSEGPEGSVLNAAGAPYVLERDPCVERTAHVGHNPDATRAVRAAVGEFLRATLLR